MCIAISNALALMSWRDFRFLHGDFMGIGSVWLLIFLFRTCKLEVR